MDKGFLLKILLAFTGILVPALYTWLVTMFPSFPLPEEQIYQFLVWLIGLFFSGYHSSQAVIRFKNNRKY